MIWEFLVNKDFMKEIGAKGGHAHRESGKPYPFSLNKSLASEAGKKSSRAKFKVGDFVKLTSKTKYKNPHPFTLTNGVIISKGENSIYKVKVLNTQEAYVDAPDSNYPAWLLEKL